MPDQIWINGEVMPLSDARIGVEDRGFQFADGVYEVVRVYHGKPFTLAPHLDRLWRSAAGVQLAPAVTRDALEGAIVRLVAQNGLRDGMVYVQVTRGVSPRNHVFPTGTTGTALAYTRPLPPVMEPGACDGVKLLTVEDERWRRCWVKSIALLPNVLAKNAAAAAGCDEAAFVEDGVVTECSASNLFAVIKGRVVTHPVGPKVLPGITRAVLLACANAIEIPVDERPLLEAEAATADELFITSTTREVSWVGRWNDRAVGDGRCGPVTLRLHRALQERVRAECGAG